MLTNRFAILVCVPTVLALAAFGAETPQSYKDLKYPAIHDIKVPEATRYTLPNGIVVYLVEDHELPKVNIHVTVAAGSRWEPADKTGLAGLLGVVMRTGGSVTRNGDKLDEELDSIGASIETGFGPDSGGVFAALLKEDLDHGLDIAADLLQHPAFPQDKIDLAKLQMRDGVARRNDNPNDIVFREFSRLLYGKDSPYVRMTEYATIDSITRDDLLAFHRRYFQPEGTIVGVNGDFNLADVRIKIEKVFGPWPRGGHPKPEAPKVDTTSRKQTEFYSITKSEMAQSWVVMGALGGRYDDPDVYALEVMNTVLGGGMSSRLFSNVRTEQALAYAVFSGWNPEWDHPGTLFIGGSSRPDATVKLYNAMLKQVNRLAEEGATDDEMARAKDQILKGFAFEFDNSMKVIARLMSYEYYGYPRDYLQQYHAHIMTVTKEDVGRMARQYLTPGKFAVLILGNGKYESPLTSLGDVRTIDIAIPSRAQKEPAAPDAGK